MTIGGQRRRRLSGFWLYLAGCLAVTAGCSQPPAPVPTPTETVAPTETPAPPEGPAPPETPVPTDTPAPTEAPLPTATEEPTATPDPLPRAAKPGEWTLEIPWIGITAPIVGVGLDPDGAIGSPNGPDDVGWFRGGAYPGKQGNAIIDGHRDWYVGPRAAVFWDLPKLAKGANVYIYDDGDAYVYEVYRKLTYDFDDPDALDTIQPSDGPILTLITCDGTFNAATHNYGERTIVQARLIATHKSSALTG